MKTITGKLLKNQTRPSPSIDCYVPDKNEHGIGLIIFPGGAYHHLSEHEGKGYAEYFCKNGIACFVVKYRVSPDGVKHPAMIEDALAAIETIKSLATDFNLNPDKVGIMGSSAGGHLAAHTLTKWQEFESELSLKPAFGILCYPVITTGEFSHSGSFNNLVDGKLSPKQMEELSCEKNITENTPPCFIWHTQEDLAVPIENSLLFAAALRKKNIPFELHTYAKGRHGIGLETPYEWEKDCLRWLKEINS